LPALKKRQSNLKIKLLLYHKLIQQYNNFFHSWKRKFRKSVLPTVICGYKNSGVAISFPTTGFVLCRKTVIFLWQLFYERIIWGGTFFFDIQKSLFYNKSSYKRKNQ
jgi:hypothetical protein